MRNFGGVSFSKKLRLHYEASKIYWTETAMTQMASWKKKRRRDAPRGDKRMGSKLKTVRKWVSDYEAPNNETNAFLLILRCPLNALTVRLVGGMVMVGKGNGGRSVKDIFNTALLSTRQWRNKPGRAIRCVPAVIP